LKFAPAEGTILPNSLSNEGTSTLTTSSSASERIAPILHTFSERFHKNFAGKHRLASPLGAWCLLAYMATNEEDTHPAITDSLGCTPDEAKKLLHSLLAEKPDAVALSLKAWVGEDFANRSVISSWREDVANIVPAEIGCPSEITLNEWANDASNGMVKEFPVHVDRETFVALFATITNVELKWEIPLRARPDEVMSDIWKVQNLLLDSDSGINPVHRDEDGRSFAVHMQMDKDVEVYSVMALDENVSEAETMAFAQRYSSGFRNAVPVGEFEIGESFNGSLDVSEYPANRANDNTFSAYLPAWKTDNRFDLLSTDLGFREALRGHYHDVEEEIYIHATQAVSAEYSAEGFRAAAVTHGWSALRSGKYGELTGRNVVLRFNRPYAVVALSSLYGEAWQGVTLFDGWITKAKDITPRRRGH
jgi:hypothetical protein